jgi:predicted kinase
VEAALQAGGSVVVDDTNCFRFLRDNYREVAGRHGVRTLVIYLDVPLELALARRRANDLKPTRPPVTEAILLELAGKFEPPASDEDLLVFPVGADPEAWVLDHLRPGPPQGGGSPAPRRRSPQPESVEEERRP